MRRWALRCCPVPAIEIARSESGTRPELLASIVIEGRDIVQKSLRARMLPAD
jgi:hypothetical protein